LRSRVAAPLDAPLPDSLCLNLEPSFQNEILIPKPKAGDLARKPGPLNLHP